MKPKLLPATGAAAAANFQPLDIKKTETENFSRETNFYEGNKNLVLKKAKNKKTKKKLKKESTKKHL